MLSKLLQPQVLIFMIPIVAIIGGVVLSAIKLSYKHEERMAKIEAGMDPDRKYQDNDYDELELDEMYQSEKVKSYRT